MAPNTQNMGSFRCSLVIIINVSAALLLKENLKNQTLRQLNR